MSMTTTDRERAAACIEALLILASKKNQKITRTKAAKLLYLADLRSVEHDGITGSGIAWRWLDYGPFDNALIQIENNLVNQKRIDRHTGVTGFRTKRYDLAASDSTESSLMEDEDFFIDHIEAVLGEWGSCSAKQIKRHAYNTPPMTTAQANNNFDELLDFTEIGHLTLADIEASTGKGPAYDSGECTFHDNENDFIASLRAGRNEQTI